MKSYGIKNGPRAAQSGCGIGRVRMRMAIAILFSIAILPASLALAGPLKILMMGTSLTQGFGLPPGTEIPVLLQQKLEKDGIRASVINAGVSGDTSSGGLSRLDWSLADRPDVAIIELGSNDALRGISPALTEKNLAEILARLKARKIPVLLLGMRAPRNLGPEYAKQFDAIYPRLASKFGVLLYPFVLDGVALDPKLNQADGMHPNPSGARIIANRIYPAVRKLIGQSQKVGAH